MTQNIDPIVLYAAYSGIIAIATGLLFIGLGLLPIEYAIVYSVTTFGMTIALAAEVLEP